MHYHGPNKFAGRLLFHNCVHRLTAIKIHLLISDFEGLVKDKTIVAGEVMHEYNEKVSARDAVSNVYADDSVVREPTREPDSQRQGGYDAPIRNCEHLGVI